MFNNEIIKDATINEINILYNYVYGEYTKNKYDYFVNKELGQELLKKENSNFSNVDLYHIPNKTLYEITRIVNLDPRKEKIKRLIKNIYSKLLYNKIYEFKKIETIIVNDNFYKTNKKMLNKLALHTSKLLIELNNSNYFTSNNSINIQDIYKKLDINNKRQMEFIKNNIVNIKLNNNFVKADEIIININEEYPIFYDKNNFSKNIEYKKIGKNGKIIMGRYDKKNFIKQICDCFYEKSVKRKKPDYLKIELLINNKINEHNLLINNEMIEYEHLDFDINYVHFELAKRFKNILSKYKKECFFDKIIIKFKKDVYIKITEIVKS